MTVADLAVAAGIEQGRLEALEGGQHDPHLDMLRALADGFGVDFATLVGRVEYPDAHTMIVAFGVRLREVRTAHSLSQEDLGRRTGLHSTAIGRIERGGREPRLTTILRLAWGLGVQPGALVDDLIV